MKKTMSFAITHFTVAFAVTYLLTGDLLLGSLVATIEPLVNTCAYHIHEKVWSTKTMSKSSKDTCNEDSSEFGHQCTVQPA
ncbi:DUF2061 domain-containing protein [Thalassotalea sp. PS06]|uniref:DUF2061 domain-containing protein n=1 Tax=Thalassotalea sp. PS06 TaxID=2594005 RepID=UPI001165779C|nr:DUF2061 domain-containing protein [Thalassotalea sp. PS06]QDP02102.1 DUF2061 domain-containing protein [Thalassotalea sp. PS06]